MLLPVTLRSLVLATWCSFAAVGLSLSSSFSAVHLSRWTIPLPPLHLGLAASLSCWVVLIHCSPAALFSPALAAYLPLQGGLSSALSQLPVSVSLIVGCKSISRSRFQLLPLMMNEKVSVNAVRCVTKALL